MSQQLSIETLKMVYWNWVGVVEKAQKDARYAVRMKNRAKHNLRKAERQKGIGIFVPLVCLMLLILAGCHTGRGLGTMVRGIGQDVEQLNDGYMEKNRRAR